MAVRAAGSPLIVDVEQCLAVHLAAALRAHRGALTRAGLAAPQGLAELESSFMARARVREGQPGTSFDSLADLSEALTMTPRLLTYDQVAASLGCSVRTVKRLVQESALVPVQVAGLVRIRTADLDAFVAALRPALSRQDVA